MAKLVLDEPETKPKLVLDELPDFGMIAIPRKELPGVWEYDKQLDDLLGDPDTNIEDFLPLDVKHEFGRIVGMTEKPDETKSKMQLSLLYKSLADIPQRISFDLMDEFNKIIFNKPIDVKKAMAEYSDYYLGAKKYTTAIKHGLKNLGVRLVQVPVGAAKMEIEIGGGIRKKFWEVIGIEQPEYQKKLDETLARWSEDMYAAIGEYYRENKAELVQIVPGTGFRGTLLQYAKQPQAFVQSLVESMGIILEGLAGTMLGGPGGGIIAMGLPLSFEVYPDVRAEDTEPLPALAQSMLTGVGEATIEQWTLSRKLGLMSNFKKYVAEGLPKMLWEGVKVYFRGTAEEGTQEFNRNFWRWVFTDRSQQWKENVAESMAIGGPMELVMAGGFSAVGAAVGPAIPKDQQIERIRQIREAVEQSVILDKEAKAEIKQELKTVREDIKQDVYKPEPVEAEKPPTEAIAAPEKPVAPITPEEAVGVAVNPIITEEKSPYKKIRAFRAEKAGRGKMTDAIEGGIYYFPTREQAELWAGDKGTVVESIIDVENAPVQAVSEGNLTRYDADVLIRTDPTGSGKIMEIVVFDEGKLAKPEAVGVAPELVPAPMGYIKAVKNAKGKYEIKMGRKAPDNPFNNEIFTGEFDTPQIARKSYEAWFLKQQAQPPTVAKAEGMIKLFEEHTTEQGGLERGLDFYRPQLKKLSDEDLGKLLDWARQPERTSFIGRFVKDEIAAVMRERGLKPERTIADAIEAEQVAKMPLFKAKAEPTKVKKPPEIKITPEVSKAKLIKEAEPTKAEEPEKAKLRQKVHAIAAVKGLTKKALSELKKKHTGFRKLTGKIASKKITLEQLQNLLKAVQKARPKQVGYKRVITKKTEKKIQSLKENLMKKTQMTERHFKDILEKEVHGKEPKYIDAKSFITETEGKDILRRMLDAAEIVRLTESFEQAIAKNPEIGKRVKSLDSRIEKAPKRDPYSLESMRYYNQQAEIVTGAPIFTSYMDLMDTHLEITKTRTATWKRLEKTTAKFKEIAKDEQALQRVSDYIASQSVLKEKPAMPTDITADETKLAKEIQKILEEYRLKVRVTKFYNWYYYKQPILDHDRYRAEITKAEDIYESKGREELIEYLDTQEWGVIKSGYEPLEILFHKIRPYTTGPTAVGKGHIKIRTDIEYHRQERNILQRLSSYMRQIDMLYNLSPKINAYVRLFDDNAGKFKEWGKVKNDIEIFLRNLKRYNVEGGFFERTIARAYSQAMRVIIMPSPVLSFRNLFQNAAFEHDKTILIDPRNTKLSDSDIEYLETYVLQTRAMVEEYFMVGEKPLPMLKTLTKLIDKVKIYPYSDIANRHWSFWAKTNQVERALKAETTKQMMTEAKFEDMKELEQRRALAIFARDGKEAMTQYIGRVHVDDIHFLYERSQRSPAEMTSLGKIVGNLMLFPRAYGEKLAHATNKILKGKTYEEQYRGLKTLFAVVGGGLIVGSIYMKVTGRKRNPYNPLEVLAFRPGGLAWGSIEAATEIYANILSAAKGNSKALAALTIAIPRAADMFIPFYDYSLRAIEAATDQKNIDRKALRQMRMMIDKEYKIRGGAYKVKRTALEKWQYFLSGPSADVKKEEKKSIRISIKRSE